MICYMDIPLKTGLIVTETDDIYDKLTCLLVMHMLMIWLYLQDSLDVDSVPTNQKLGDFFL
jgi:hypothetical protein